MRQHGQQRDRAHHRRAQHAGRRLHHDDERHQRHARPARPRPAGRSAAPSTAPPRRRSSRWPRTPPSDVSGPRCGTASVVGRRDRRGVAEHEGGQHRRLVGGQHLPSRGGEPGAHRLRRPLHRRGLAQRRLTGGRQHRDGQIAAGRPADAGPEPRPAGPRAQLGESAAPARKPLPARTFRPSPSRLRLPRNISRPLPSDRGLSVGVTVTAADRRRTGAAIGWSRTCRVAQRDRDAESRADHRGRRPPPTAAARSAGFAAPRHRTTPPSRRRRSRTPRASRAPTDHRMPAAVTAQLVSAAGTSRRSSRARAARGAPLTPAPGPAASPAAPGRCRRRRRVGRRW